MAKPETLFIQKIHKTLDKKIYREKMNNPYRGGTPDVYYELPSGKILWVEYKFIDKLPRAHVLRLSELQKRWLRRAYRNSVPVAVILGWKEGRTSNGVIFTEPDDWVVTHKKDSIIDRQMSVAEIAEWIKG